MKGDIRIFLTTPLILSILWLIFLRFVTVVDLFNDLSYGFIDLLIGHYLLGGIHKKYIQPVFNGQIVLLFSETLTYASFQQIALDCPLEKFLGYRYHYSVDLIACTLPAEKAHS